MVLWAGYTEEYGGKPEELFVMDWDTLEWSRSGRKRLGKDESPDEILMVLGSVIWSGYFKNLDCINSRWPQCQKQAPENITLQESNSGFSQIIGAKPTPDLPEGALCQDCTCEVSEGECSWTDLDVALKECGQWFECGSVYWSEEDSKYIAKGTANVALDTTQNDKDVAWIKDKGEFSNFKTKIQ